MNKPVAFLGVLVLFVALMEGGCGAPRTIDLTSCESPYPDPSCPKEETCPGQCVPIPPLGGWELSVLLWTGPELDAPACPADRAPFVGYEGFADPEPSDPPVCPACTCEPPTGECGLPSVLTVSTETCTNDTPMATHKDFSGLSRPGVCNSDNAILLDEGQQSVTVGPLTLTETGCSPGLPPPLDGAPSWKTFARACHGTFSPCLDLSKVCVPAAPPPPPGFSQCIFGAGDRECPEDYPNKHVFYDEVSDARACSACSCGAPEGGVCTTTVTIFEDALCSMGAIPADVTSAAPKCISISAGANLGGKTVTVPSYQPGTCTPVGGEAIGSIELKGPSTFCCQ